MKDKLEKFVQENREEFDSFEPRPDLWQDISKELHQKKTANIGWLSRAHLWKYAAAIALLVTVSFMIWKGIPDTTPSEVAEVTQMNTMQEVAPQLAEVETYYTSLIREKKQEIGSYDLKSLGIEEDLQQDVAGLDSSYARLKRELLTTPNKEKIIDAMIVNLQTRMDILNQQLKTLEKIQQLKTQKKNGHIQA